MNKGGVRGTSAGGGSLVDNETNALRGQDSTVLLTANRFFLTGLGPSNPNYEDSTSTVRSSKSTFNDVFWSTNPSPGAESFYSLGYGNGRWVVGFSQMYTSSDALAWVKVGGSGIFAYSLAYANSLWVIGGASGAIRTSTDAVTWVTRTSNVGGTSNIYSVAYGNGLWVAAGQNGTLRTSTDAVTWVSRNPNFPGNLGVSDISAVAYANGLWVIAGNQGLSTSSDAITWSRNTPITRLFTSVVYDNGRWMLTADGGAIYTSTDGLSWVTQSTSFGTERVLAVAYGRGVWLATALSGLLNASVQAPVAYPATISSTKMWFLP